MTIPFVDLKKQYENIAPLIISDIYTCIERGTFVGGYWVDTFQKAFAEFHDVNYCVGVGSGTDALLLSLLALDIGPGDEVIVPANTFIATAFAVSHARAKVVFVDADPKTYNIDCEKIEEAITDKTKAIIPVHLYGNPVDMKKVLEIANKYNLKVIEDCAQAIGAVYNNQKVGTFGDIGAFSFYPTKNLGGLGQGGAIITDSKELADKIESLANVGRVKDSHYEYQYVGFNSRLDSINALFLYYCLNEISTWNFFRTFFATLYNTGIDNIKNLDRQHTVRSKFKVSNVYHLYEVKCKSRNIRDSLQRYLKSNGVEAALHYPIPCHKQTAYKEYNKQVFPVAEELSKTLLSLPMHPNLSGEKVRFITVLLDNFLNGK